MRDRVLARANPVVGTLHTPPLAWPMPSDGGGEVFSFFVEKLDLGDAAAAAPGVGGDGEVERQTKANWMRGLHLMFF